MTKISFLRTLLFVVSFLGLSSSTPCFGQSGESNVNVPTVLLSVHDKAALHAVDSTVVFLSGSEPDFAQVLQDAISIALRNIGLHVVSRTELEQAVAQDFAKWSSTSPDTTNSETEPELDDSAIAQLVKVDAYLTGAVLIGRKQYAISYEKNKIQANNGVDKLVVAAISFQIVNALEKRTILEAVVNYSQGENIPSVAHYICGLIEKQRSR